MKHYHPAAAIHTVPLLVRDGQKKVEGTEQLETRLKYTYICSPSLPGGTGREALLRRVWGAFLLPWEGKIPSSSDSANEPFGENISR